MNERQGKNGGESAASHDALYQRITSSSDEAIKVALGLVDEADKAAQKMVAECETPWRTIGVAAARVRACARYGVLVVGEEMKQRCYPSHR